MNEAGRSGQCVTFFAAADEKRFTILVRLVADSVRLAFTCLSARADIRTGSSSTRRWCATVGTQRPGSLSDARSHAWWDAQAEASLGSSPGSPGCMDRGVGEDMRRRTAKSSVQHLLTATTSTARFQWYQKTTNTRIERMFSNAENQVVGRGTAGNQALRRALRSPSCTMSISQNSR